MRFFKSFKPQKPKFLRTLPRRRPFLYKLAKHKCTECLKCEEACPTQAIDIVAFPEIAKKKDMSKASFDPQKNIYKFYIDFSKCIYCHLCVQICPAKALSMEQGEIPAVFNKNQLKKDLMVEKS